MDRWDFLWRPFGCLAWQSGQKPGMGCWEKSVFFVTKIHGGERFDKLFPGVPEGHFLNHQIVIFTFLKHHKYHSKSLNLGLVGVSGLVVYSGSFVFGETSEVSISYGSTIGGLYVSTLKTCKPVAGCCA